MAGGPTNTAKSGKKAPKPPAGSTGGAKKVVATNKKVRHDYDVLETFEAGMVLVGSEVKSLRDAKVQMRDAYARVERSEMLLLGLNISPYGFAHGFGAHQPERARKLLMHKREIVELGNRMAQEGLSLLPTSIYFVDGRAKIELALAKGRRTQDKRSALADRDAKLDIDRAMAANRRAIASRRRFD
jgi:SsrA-binding protein